MSQRATALVPPSPAKDRAVRHAGDIRFHLRNAELGAERVEHRAHTRRGRDLARKIREATSTLKRYAAELEREVEGS